MKLWSMIFYASIAINTHAMEFNQAFNQLQDLTHKMEYFITQGEHLKTDNNLRNMSAEYFATCAQYKTLIMNILATYNYPESKELLEHWCLQQSYYSRLKIHRTFQRMAHINEATIQTWSHLKNVEEVRTWLLHITPKPEFNIPYALTSSFFLPRNILHLTCCAIGLYACYRLHIRNKQQYELPR